MTSVETIAVRTNKSASSVGAWNQYPASTRQETRQENPYPLSNPPPPGGMDTQTRRLSGPDGSEYLPYVVGRGNVLLLPRHESLLSTCHKYFDTLSSVIQDQRRVSYSIRGALTKENKSWGYTAVFILRRSKAGLRCVLLVLKATSSDFAHAKGSRARFSSGPDAPSGKAVC